MVKTKSMNISIITATYNSGSHIAGCLASVNNQSHNNIEHIIIDGAFTDNTLDIIKATLSKDHANGRTQLISEPDNGIYDAMNKGIRLATSDIIGILNSDDFYASDRIIEKIGLKLLTLPGQKVKHKKLIFVKV
jgi:glycosyltransferase involved in cell wall biosynthesis